MALDFSKLGKPETLEERARRDAEMDSQARQAWIDERREKIKHEEVFTHKANSDFARHRTPSGDIVIGFRSLDKRGQTKPVRWAFHPDDEESASIVEKRLMTENIKIEAKGYYQPITTTKGKTFAFQIVDAKVKTLSVNAALHARYLADMGLPSEPAAAGTAAEAPAVLEAVPAAVEAKKPRRAANKAAARDAQATAPLVEPAAQADQLAATDEPSGRSLAQEAGENAASETAKPVDLPRADEQGQPTRPEIAGSAVEALQTADIATEKSAAPAPAANENKESPMNAQAPIVAEQPRAPAADHSSKAVADKPAQRAAGRRQVRLPIDDFRMTAPQAGPARKIVADLQPQVLEGLKLLPQWAAIERLGGHLKWSSNIVWRMLDEARAVDPLRDDEDPQNVPQRHVDMATQLVNWHLRRMSGIGGSEVGVLVGEKRCMPPKFETTARTIVAIKLCMALPERTNKYMTRGHRAEPFIRDEFMRMHPHARRDETGLRIAKGGRPAFAPWLIGSPDDMIIVADPQTGRRERIIPDYKSMGENAIKDVRANGVPFNYKCQLHHYGLISSAAGVSSSRAWLVPFDSQVWTPLVYDVPWDADLLKECLEVSREVWRDHVLAGVLPEEAATVVISKDGMRDPAAQLAVLDAAALAIAARKEAILTELTETLNTRREEGVADFGPWTLKAKTKFDAEQIKDMAFAFDIDTAPFVVADPKSPDKDACVGIAQSFVDAMKVRDASEAQMQGSGQEAFLRALTIVEEKVADGMPLKTSLNVEALSKAIVEKGGDPKCAVTFSAEFACSRKKAEYPKLASFRDDVAEVVRETVAYCGQAVFARWPELAHSEVIEQMEAENPDAADALGATG